MISKCAASSGVAWITGPANSHPRGVSWFSVPDHIACDPCRPGCGFRTESLLASLAIVRPLCCLLLQETEKTVTVRKLGPVGPQSRALTLESVMLQS